MEHYKNDKDQSKTTELLCMIGDKMTETEAYYNNNKLSFEDAYCAFQYYNVLASESLSISDGIFNKSGCLRRIRNKMEFLIGKNSINKQKKAAYETILIACDQLLSDC